MKILLSVILIFVFVSNTFSSPLIFTATKTVKGELIELGTVDTTKYKQIRIGISNDSKTGITTVEILGIEGDSQYTLHYSEDRFRSNTYTFDTPPSKIKISVKGTGNYKIHIWAS